MFLPKLNPNFGEHLSSLGLVEAHPEQLALFKAVRGGTDLVWCADAGSGKSSAMATTLIHQLKEPFEDAPRAIVLVPKKECVFELMELYQALSKGTDLRILPAFEGKPWKDQMEAIYIGADIVIGTYARLQEIYFKNGLNLNKVRYTVIEDAHYITHQQLPQLERMLLSLEKTQHSLLGNTFSERIEKIAELHFKKVLLIGEE